MRVAVCDDHALFADALADALQRLGHVVVGTAGTLDEVVDLVARERPEICLLDLWFDGLPSLDVARGLREEHPETRIVLLTVGVEHAAPVRTGEHPKATVLDRRVVEGDPDRGELAIVAVVLLAACDGGREAVLALEEDVIQAIVGKHWSLALVVQTLARVAAGRHVRRLVPLRAEGRQPVTPHLTAREREVLALLATGASTAQIRQHLDISEHTVRTHVRSLLSKLGVHSRVEALRVAHDRGLVQTGTAEG